MTAGRRLLALVASAIVLAGTMLVTVRLVRDSTAPAPDLDDVDWSAIRHPMNCADLGQEVTKVAIGDATGDGRAEAVIVVRCAAGAGSPPSGVFVYRSEAGRTEPRLLDTLVRPEEDLLIDNATATVEGITLKGYAYSSPNVPRCCPDRRVDWRWQWTGSDFARVG
jgi:hypothetical protein